MGLAGQFQNLLEVYTRSLQGFCLLAEENRIKNHSVADEIRLSALENSGGDGTQYVFLSVKFEGMACVRPSLETRYGIVAGSKDIHDLTFSFVAPLEAEQNVNFHCHFRNFE